MVHFTKLVFIALSGVDPLIFFALICLGLGICFVLAFAELEQVRVRHLQQSKARRLPPKSQAVFRQPPSDRQS